MKGWRGDGPGWRSAGMLTLALLLAACASPRHQAPVEDRSGPTRPPASAAAPAAGGSTTPPVSAAAGAAARPTPTAEAVARPGFHIVRPGDTLIRIGLDNGQNWRDIVRWNAIENPNVIEVGQVLRVVAPGTEAAAATRPVTTAASADPRPLPPAGTAAEPAAAASAAAPEGTPVAAAAVAARPRDGDEEVNWLWPAAGPVLTAFDDARSNKGLAIGGKAGDAVMAAADGRVVYAGSGLRGYGNLVIVKHNNTFLTAYAHNQTLLVKEDQVVRRGQRIAEMGSSDAERVQLHFEIRRQGKPVDPARLLPPR